MTVCFRVVWLDVRERAAVYAPLGRRESRIKQQAMFTRRARTQANGCARPPPSIRVPKMTPIASLAPRKFIFGIPCTIGARPPSLFYPRCRHSAWRRRPRTLGTIAKGVERCRSDSLGNLWTANKAIKSRWLDLQTPAVCCICPLPPSLELLPNLSATQSRHGMTDP